MTIQQAAEICHEANKAYCNAINDYSQAHWNDAPQWQRDSAVAGVKHKLANPQSTPEDQHVAWCNHKVADGWKYGPVKDADKKEHPCLVPYGDLPVEQRVKDELFTAIVKALSDAIES